jgi:Cu(I)/Ag(I) efflux system protein CusF
MTLSSDAFPTKEHSMKKFFTPLLVSLLAAGPVLAQHHAHSPASASRAAEPTATDGVVQKIDRSAGRITLKHGEIRNVGMPPMTMTFPVKEPAYLDKVKVGEKVTFLVEQAGSGALTVIAIDKVN